MAQEPLFAWEKLPEKKAEGQNIRFRGIRINSVDPKEEYVKIPAMLDDLPVLELGPYAMENSSVREIELPASLERIGRYAFYNCEKLERIHLSEGVRDIGSGAFTGVHRVRSILLTMQEENGRQAVLQELLSDFSETIEVTLEMPGQEIRLLFPEYYEQGVENTPARIIVNQFFGTGMKYRNCFLGRQLQYEEYDKLFPLAVAGERSEVVRKLALLRLMSPYKLKNLYRVKYLDWIRDNAQEILEDLIREKRLEEIRFLLENADISGKIRKQAAILCSDTGFAEAVSLFMEQQNAESDEDGPDTGSLQTGEKAASVIFSSFDLDEI